LHVKAYGPAADLFNHANTMIRINYCVADLKAR